MVLPVAPGSSQAPESPPGPRRPPPDLQVALQATFSFPFRLNLCPQCEQGNGRPSAPGPRPSALGPRWESGPSCCWSEESALLTGSERLAVFPAIRRGSPDRLLPPPGPGISQLVFNLQGFRVLAVQTGASTPPLQSPTAAQHLQ